MKANLTAVPIKTRAPARGSRHVVVAANDLYRVTIGLTVQAYDRLEVLRVERDEVSIADVARAACRLADRITRAKKDGKVICLLGPDAQVVTLDSFLAKQPAPAAAEKPERVKSSQIRRLTFGLTQAGYQRLQTLLEDSDSDTFADFVRQALRTFDRLHQAEKAGWTAVFVDPTQRANVHELVAFAT